MDLFSAKYSIPYLDQNFVLSDEIFPFKEVADCTLFVQDAKINFSSLSQHAPGAVKTCEFGLAAASQWNITPWGKNRSRPLERAVRILNGKGIKLWLMAEERIIENCRSKDLEGFWAKLSASIARNPQNHIRLENPFRKQPEFPAPYTCDKEFHPEKITDHYAVGIAPYCNLPASHFGDITGKHPSDPRIVVMDGGMLGPVNRIMGYKHMTRLAMNGTAAAPQNPSYVIVESEYHVDLAAFLKQKFPNDKRLVLKHVAASRGEGVVVLDASSEEVLDKQLKELLKEKSEFKQVSQISVCLVESFVSTKEATSTKPNSALSETIVRVVYLGLKDQNKVELFTLDGVKCYENTEGHKTPLTKGMVKLGKFNDGLMEVLNKEQLDLIHKNVFPQLSKAAERAMNYDSSKAVLNFLQSDNHLLNLIGIEFFVPTHLCTYRDNKEGNLVISEKHCQLLLNLLDRNKHHLVLKRIFENIILHEGSKCFDTYKFELPPNFILLTERVLSLAAKEVSIKLIITGGLVTLYENLFTKGIQQEKELFLLVIRYLQTDFLPNCPRDFSKILWGIDLQFEKDRLPINDDEGQLRVLRKKKPAYIPEKAYEKLLHKLSNGFGSFYYTYPALKCLFTGTDSNTFSEEEWNDFIDWIDELRGSSEAGNSLVILPEMMQLGLNLEEIKKIVGEYMSDQWCIHYVFEFCSLIKILAQFKEIKRDEVYPFLVNITTYRVNKNAYQYLVHYLRQAEKKTSDINAFLRHTNRVIADYQPVVKDISYEKFFGLVKTLVERLPEFR